MVKETKYYDTLGVCCPHLTASCCFQALTRPSGLPHSHRGRIEEGLQGERSEVPSWYVYAWFPPFSAAPSHSNISLTQTRTPTTPKPKISSRRSPTPTKSYPTPRSAKYTTSMVRPAWKEVLVAAAWPPRTCSRSSSAVVVASAAWAACLVV